MFNREDWILDKQNPMISIKKWQTTVDLITRLYEASAAYITQCSADQFQMVVTSENSSEPYKAGNKFERSDNLFCEKVISSCELLYENHASGQSQWRNNPMVAESNINSYLGVPIYWPDGSNFGTLSVVDYAVTHYNKTYQDLIWQFRDLVEADLLLNQQFLQLLELSAKDDLTRLLNRRGFFVQADKQVRLANRLNQKIGVLYLDLDNLKGINDQHGHRVGDKVIEALATAIRNMLRESDIAGRFGGDEFVIVMLAEEENALYKLTQRIRMELKDQCIGELANLNIRVSIGSGLYIPSQDSSIEKMISEVDQLMYQDKQNNTIRAVK